MTLLQYYLFANIYILAFWICYRIWLRNLRYFKSIRIYLNAALVLSALLPFVQYGITDLIGPSGIVTAGQNLPLAGIIYNHRIGETLSTQKDDFYIWPRLFEILLITGSFITALIYGFKHLKIMSIIRRSNEHLILENRLKVSKSDDVTIPFVYSSRIVLPTCISSEELPLVLEHETLHYQNGHHFDNILYSVLHVIFWANPFFLLLKRALQLNHEYQVDGQIISAGMDQISYKLALIKYSVGWRKFSLANGLSSSDIKNRLTMINDNCVLKGKWRFYILIPMMGFLFTIFCYACIHPEQKEVPSQTLVTENQNDSLVVEFIDVTNEDLSDVNRKTVISVLMNRNSQLMIAGEKYPKNAEQKIISEYNKRLEEYTDVRIIVQKDLSANMDEYQKLLDVISTALFKIREMHSIRLFGGNFDSLSVTEKTVIDDLIPLKIYGVLPDKNMNHNSKPE